MTNQPSQSTACHGRLTYHRNVFVTVNRISPTEMLAQSVLVGTGREAAARIRARTNDLSIQEASWKIYRSADTALPGGRTVAELKGVKAYFDADPALRAVGDKDGELPREMLSECVKGISLAETYLFPDRGFSSADAFETAVINKSYADSCRLYSNLDRVGKTWYEYIADRKWGEALYNLSKTAVIRSKAEGDFFIYGGFTDCFQDLGVSLGLKDGVVSDADGEFLRVPDSICLENMALLDALKGQPAAFLTEQQVENCCGGPQGCCHIVDLLNHMLKALQEVHIQDRQC